MTDADGSAVAVATRDGAATPTPAAGPSAGRPTDRWALIAFLVVAVVSIPLLLRLGHDRWFQFDDWDFLASRDGGNLRDLLEPHGAHWSTLPIIAYRAEWYLFGLHSYVPYQAVSVLSHLTVVLLVRTVMRRAGVRPWTATAAVLPLVFFGAGEENVTWGFQINFTMSLAFGLAQLLLADHDGPLDRRDLVALLAGLAALMSSGIGVTMVAVVGLAVLVRRGWRVAALQTVPLGAAYLVWHLAIASDGYEQDVSDPLDALRFARTTIAAGFGGLAQVPGLGWVLGCLVVGGTFLAWRGRPWGELRKVAAAPAAMAAGAFVFVLITASGRVGFAPGIERSTRYIHVFGVLLLPLVAVAADAVMRRWRVTVPVLAAFLVASTVGNVDDFSNERPYGGDFLAAYRASFLAIPRVPLAEQVPRDLRPDRSLAPYVSVGWLLDGVRSGRIPAPEDVQPETLAATEVRVALQENPRHRPARCETVTPGTPITLQPGSSVRLRGEGQLWVGYANATGAVGLVPFPWRDAPIVAYAGPLTVNVSSVPEGQPVELCDPGGRPVSVLSGP
ncbi:MAG TPA: hypothetical protein VFM27_10750 [Acidimicrobiales bacterium]|nr:hypothetical protein [Acidimicrobiales bacterium]